MSTTNGSWVVKLSHYRIVGSFLIGLSSEPMQPPTAIGAVKFWHGSDGSGVLTSPAVPEDVWCFITVIDTEDADPSGYRTLDAGDDVKFRYERGHQEGYCSSLRRCTAFTERSQSRSPASCSQVRT